jgi:type II secretory ATPase GspE/PulE/Tfp pilus assembly ATPase PilB-like protein
MANLDIGERRLPQDGRILLRGADEKEWDLRVAVLPTAYGERVVLRLLDRASVLLGLGDLGLAEPDQRRLRDLAARPHGMVLVTGPTGSGKTTTLYALLHEVRSPERNVMTVEDPVEYEIPGIAQMPVKPQIGLDFAAGLRAILRQDPDVVMVGEIRDSETVRVAIQASLTGHLVLSTLHTNDAASAPARLLDMGAEPYLLATSLAGVIAQRLVRTVCDACAEKVRENGFEFRRGKGCAACRGTGYAGRTGIFEILEVDETARRLIVDRAPAAAYLEAAARAGRHRPIRDDGLAKVRAGATTPEEVLRVTSEG